jgi:hypothetical protein
MKIKGVCLAVLCSAFLSHAQSQADSGVGSLIVLDPLNHKTEEIYIPLRTTRFIALPKSAGTGFFWDAKLGGEGIAKVEYAYSRPVNKAVPSGFVGFPEYDVFGVTGIIVGRASVSFSLQRSRSKPISNQFITVNVVEK